MNYLSQELGTKAMKLIELHCNTKGICFNRICGNRIEVFNPTDSEYCSLMRVELYTQERLK